MAKSVEGMQSGSDFGWRIMSALAACIVAASAGPALGQDASPGSTVAQVSLTPTGAQLPTEDRRVHGVSLNLVYGVQTEVNGLDLGLVNGIEESMRGLGIGMANVTGGSAMGLQVATGNTVEGDVSGIQLGVLANQANRAMRGMQIGAGGNGAKSASGLQLGFYNWTAEKNAGAQIGMVGRAGALRGTQVSALVSTVDECDGLQIASLFTLANSGRCIQLGLLNINDSGFIKILPVVNFSFRGSSKATPTGASGQSL